MCGFAGYLGGRLTLKDGELVLQRMTDTMVARGPDDSGYWFHPQKRIGLGHRRLAVIDPSPSGHQPMHSSTGRYVLAFNGEIYNHLLLRQELEMKGVAPACRGHSDTETLLAAFDIWGGHKAIECMTGMFAFSVWDRTEDKLVLGRDRVGEKPLYYGWQGETFLFGSDLRALKKHPAFTPEIDRNAMTLFLRYGYIPAPHSIYQGISKLQPGCLLSVSLARKQPVISCYWSARDVAVQGVLKPFSGSDVEAVDELERLCMTAVGQQMIADVPLGAFLSGGIDSSTVVALMRAQTRQPVKTFTIGFEQRGYNEANHAKAVATTLGTEHTELYVTSRTFMDAIPCLPALYDEPFSDSSQIPTFLLSKLARQQVTVALSGDAGDELFCGYDRYRMATNFWENVMSLPESLRAMVATVLTSISPEWWELLSGLLPKKRQIAHFGQKVHKGARVLTNASADAFYMGLVSHAHSPETCVIGGMEPQTLINGKQPDLSGLNAAQQMMVLDLLTYLVDDILVKVDRASMGVSLETRMPFLDHHIVEFAWKLPMSMKLKGGQSKWVLRQVLSHHMSQELIERPKQGFGVPLHDWLLGALRDWAESLLDESRLRQEGFFEVNVVRKLWRSFLEKSQNQNDSTCLWDIIMFQAWLEYENR